MDAKDPRIAMLATVAYGSPYIPSAATLDEIREARRIEDARQRKNREGHLALLKSTRLGVVELNRRFAEQVEWNKQVDAKRAAKRLQKKGY